MAWLLVCWSVFFFRSSGSWQSDPVARWEDCREVCSKWRAQGVDVDETVFEDTPHVQVKSRKLHLFTAAPYQITSSQPRKRKKHKNDGFEKKIFKPLQSSHMNAIPAGFLGLLAKAFAARAGALPWRARFFSRKTRPSRKVALPSWIVDLEKPEKKERNS